MKCLVAQVLAESREHFLWHVREEELDREHRAPNIDIGRDGRTSRVNVTPSPLWDKDVGQWEDTY